jgi:hypothetical protein
MERDGSKWTRKRGGNSVYNSPAAKSVHTPPKQREGSPEWNGMNRRKGRGWPKKYGWRMPLGPEGTKEGEDRMELEAKKRKKGASYSIWPGSWRKEGGKVRKEGEGGRVAEG